jgi:hypothetical protein
VLPRTPTHTTACHQRGGGGRGAAGTDRIGDAHGRCLMCGARLRAGHCIQGVLYDVGWLEVII